MGVLFWFFYTLVFVAGLVVNGIGLVLATSAGLIFLHSVCVFALVLFFVYTLVQELS